MSTKDIKRYKKYEAQITNLFDKHIYHNTEYFCLKSFLSDVKTLREPLGYFYNHFKRSENDSRSGMETYGYSSNDSITNNVLYISDKWQCQFRVRWLIDLIEYKELK